MTRALLLLPLLAGCATWAPRDRALGTAFTLAASADIGTTIALLPDPLLYETNPWLGAKPSAAKVLALGTVAIGGALIVADALPKKVRPWWLLAVTGIELFMVVNNVRLM